MTAEPLLTIVTVVRNGEAHLEECLRSVDKQGDVGYEHWLVDGDSTDHTLDIIRSFADPKRFWISEPDQGVYDAMNKAISKAAGQWVLFLGSDDRLRPGVLQKVLPHLSDPRVIYYGDVWMMHRRRRYDGRFSAFKLARKNICQQAIFYPRSIFQAHRFDRAYSIQADWVFNMACFRDPSFRFQYIPFLIADFNDQGGVSSNHRDLALENNYTKLLQAYFPVPVAWPMTLAVWGWRGLKKLSAGVRRA